MKGKEESKNIDLSLKYNVVCSETALIAFIENENKIIGESKLVDFDFASQEKNNQPVFRSINQNLCKGVMKKSIVKPNNSIPISNVAAKRSKCKLESKSSIRSREAEYDDECIAENNLMDFCSSPIMDNCMDMKQKKSEKFEEKKKPQSVNIYDRIVLSQNINGFWSKTAVNIPTDLISKYQTKYDEIIALVKSSLSSVDLSIAGEEDIITTLFVIYLLKNEFKSLINEHKLIINKGEKALKSRLRTLYAQ